MGDGSWDPGLGISLSAENPDWYLLADLFGRANTSGKHGIDPGDLVGFDLNVGWHPFHDNARNLGAFVMLDLEARYQGRGLDDTGSVTGGRRLSLGPVLVLYKDNVMFRGELKFPVYQRVFGIQVSRGLLFNLGVGVTF